MWQVKTFPKFKNEKEREQSRQQMQRWLNDRQGLIEWQEVFVDNAHAVEWRPLRKIA